MIGNKVRENLDKLFAKFPKNIRLRFYSILQNPVFIKAAEYAVRFLLSWILASARIFGEYAPFAAGFVAASGAGTAALFAAIGAITGAVFGGGVIWAAKYAAITTLIFASAFVFKDTPIFRKLWFMPLISAFMAACTGFVYASDASWSPIASTFFLMETVLIAGSAYFYKLVLSPSNTEESDSFKRRISFIIFFATLLISLSEYTLFTFISLGRILAVMTVMIAGFKGGLSWGAVSGIALGVAMDVASGVPPFFSAAFSLAGLISGVFSKNSRLIFVIVYVISNALAAFWSRESFLLREALLYETFIASVLFLMLPSRFLSGFKDGMMFTADAFEGALRSKLYVKGKTEKAARAFRDVYDILRRNTEAGRNDNDIATVFDIAADICCRKCRRSMLCWQKEYNDTYNVMNDASVEMLKRGMLLEEDFPEHFINKCLNIQGFIAAANSELRALLQRRQFKSRLRENQELLFTQYLDMSGVLRSVAEELEGSTSWEREIEKRIKLYLRATDSDISAAVFSDKNNRIHIELEGAGVTLLRKREAYLDKLSSVAGKRLCELDSTSKYKLILLEAEPLAASIGIASMRKHGEQLSGDKGTYFKTDEGLLCVILSDGMGSGGEAAEDSASVIRILERFIKAGVPAEISLKILAAAMMLRAEANAGCATVDLMCVNLFSGETQLFKYGAAPSYVKRGRHVQRVLGESLAAGLSVSGGYAPDCTKLKLEAGAIAVIASDGVTGFIRDDNWLLEIMSATDDMTARDLARNILEKAVEINGCDDDMTVLTITLQARS